MFNPWFRRYRNDLVQKAREMRRAATPAENQLWYGYLRYLRPRFLRQRPIACYIVDFYYPKLELVIEVDGGMHQEESAQQYDDRRTALLASLGLRVLRFTNQDVLRDFDAVQRIIAQKLTASRAANTPLRSRGVTGSIQVNPERLGGF